jgi:hypothetical protein
MRRLFCSPFRSKVFGSKGEADKKRDDGKGEQEKGAWGIAEVGRCATWGTPPPSWQGKECAINSNSRSRSHSVSSLSQVLDVNRHLNTALVPLLTSAEVEGKVVILQTFKN